MNTPAPTIAPGESAVRPCVLLVDDSPSNLSVLLDLLIGEGFEVLVADGGERALLQVRHRLPDLILLDALMPGLDGFATCRRLKDDAATRDIPVLFMTALTDTAARLAGFAAGAVDFISKPFEPEEVLARLRAHLELQRLRRTLETEVRLRREAEARLQEALPGAVAVADREGQLVFCTRRARELLARHLPDGGSTEVLPAALLEGQAPPAHTDGGRLRVRRFAEAGAESGAGGELAVLLLGEEAPDPSLVLLGALGLTEREAEVLYWVGEGKTSPEIAVILGMALKTVKKHLQHVYEKMGLETRTAAALRANEILRLADGRT